MAGPADKTSLMDALNRADEDQIPSGRIRPSVNDEMLSKIISDNQNKQDPLSKAWGILSGPRPPTGFRVLDQAINSPAIHPAKAVNDLATGLVESLGRVQRLGSGAYPRDARTGLVDALYEDQVAEDVTLAVLDWGLPAASVASARGTSASTLGVFGSRDIPAGDLATAKTMKAEGKSQDDIWKATGVWEQRSDKFIREFNDSNLKFKPTAIQEQKLEVTGKDPITYNTMSGKAVDIIEDHPLFGTYPELKNAVIDIEINPEVGIANPNGQVINSLSNEPHIVGEANNVEDALSLLRHEFQHIIQAKDELPRGGHPENPNNVALWMASKREKASALDDQIAKDLEGTGADVFRNAYVNLKNAYKEGIELANRGARTDDPALQEITGKAKNITKSLAARLGVERAGRIADNIFKQTQILLEPNPNDARPGDLKELNNLTPEARGARRVYTRLGGEVQARLAQRRGNLGIIGRRTQSPIYNEGDFSDASRYREDINPILQVDDYKARDVQRMDVPNDIKTQIRDVLRVGNKQYQVWELLVAEGKSREEVAKALGMTRTRLANVINDMRSNLERRGFKDYAPIRSPVGKNDHSFKRKDDIQSSAPSDRDPDTIGVSPPPVPAKPVSEFISKPNEERIQTLLRPSNDAEPLNPNLTRAEQGPLMSRERALAEDTKLVQRDFKQEQLEAEAEYEPLVRTWLDLIYRKETDKFFLNRMEKSGVTNSDIFHVIEIVEEGVSEYNKFLKLLMNEVESNPTPKGKALLKFSEDLLKTFLNPPKKD